MNMAKKSPVHLWITQDTSGQEELREFREHTRSFPCSFNLGEVNLDIGENKFSSLDLKVPSVSKTLWENIRDRLQDDGDEDDDSFDKPVWRENLLSRAFAALNEIPRAKEINRKILQQHGDKNLVALTNSAYLAVLADEIQDAFSIVGKLEQMQKDISSFRDMKIEAIIEQGFQYRKIGGAKSLLCSIILLTRALEFRPRDERLQFMLAMVFRRCTHFKLYLEDHEAIDYRQFAKEAASRLFEISQLSRSIPIKASALVELAYLKRSDYLINGEEWIDIIGLTDWKDLVKESLEVQKNKPCAKVLKMAGQMFRYSQLPADLEKAEELLNQSISLKPSTRAYHHLGLIYRRKSIEFERNNRNRTNYLRDRPSTLVYQFPANRRQTESSSQPENLPPLCASEQMLEEKYKRLSQITKAVSHSGKLKPFRFDNPFVKIAISCFEKSNDLSNYQNLPCVYDLAIIHAQMGQYKEAKSSCKRIISAISDGTNSKLHLVNAYNLYGLCCAFEAEKAEGEAKKFLLNDCEKKLMEAVSEASKLAANVPELSECYKHLWSAFDELQEKFLFEGSKESQEKLFKLCELVKDYRMYILALDKELLKPECELDKSAQERGIECYLRSNSFNAAKMLLSLHALRKGGKDILTWKNSTQFKQVMLLSAEEDLKDQLNHWQRDQSKSIANSTWKEMFDKEFEGEIPMKQTSQNGADTDETYDVVIVEDSFEEEITSLCGQSLKTIIGEIFGLNVALAHEIICPGVPDFLIDDALSNSKVVIFVLNGNSNDLLLQSIEEDSLNPLGNGIISGNSGSNSGNSAEYSVPDNLQEVSAAGGAKDHRKSVSSEEHSKLSNKYTFIIQACSSSCLIHNMPEHILSLNVGEFSPQATPKRLQDFPCLPLTRLEFQELSQNTSQAVETIMKLFKSIIRQKV